MLPPSNWANFREFLNIKSLYLHLIQWGPFRRFFRGLRARILRGLGHPDAYDDLARFARRVEADMFLDIGCHYGDALIRFLEAGVRCPVIAFDPLEKNLRVARGKLNHRREVRFEQLAISDQDGFADFFVNRNEQTSSLLENAHGNLESFREDTDHQAVVKVPVLKLDTWYPNLPMPRPRRVVVKCDTQGAEHRVVQGGIDFFRNHVEAFYAEVMLGDMYQGQSDFLFLRNLLERDCGLTLHNIYPCLQDAKGRAVQMDVLWVRLP